MQRLLALTSFALLSACSNMTGMQQSLTDLTTSSLVGTWTGELNCANRPHTQRVILTFKQSNFPLIAQGQGYSKATNSQGSAEFMVTQIEGEMSLAGNAHITEKAWIVKPSSGWNLMPWQGTRTSPTTIRAQTCGAELVLTKVSDAFIDELRPRVVFEQYAHLFPVAGAQK